MHTWTKDHIERIPITYLPTYIHNPTACVAGRPLSLASSAYLFSSSVTSRLYSSRPLRFIITDFWPVCLSSPVHSPSSLLHTACFLLLLQAGQGTLYSISRHSRPHHSFRDHCPRSQSRQSPPLSRFFDPHQPLAQCPPTSQTLPPVYRPASLPAKRPRRISAISPGKTIESTSFPTGDFLPTPALAPGLHGNGHKRAEISPNDIPCESLSWDSSWPASPALAAAP